jgi:hypothetical protein
MHMLSNTLVINWAGEARTLIKVNQDAFTSQYRLKLSDSGGVNQWDAFIRHTTTKPSNGVTFDRHNVEIKLTYTPFDTSKPARYVRVYAVVEVPSSAPVNDVIDLGDALGDLLKDNSFATSIWSGES